jgi:hypothetical protein
MFPDLFGPEVWGARGSEDLFIFMRSEQEYYFSNYNRLTLCLKGKGHSMTCLGRNRRNT